MSYIESVATENYEVIASYVGPDNETAVAWNNFEVRLNAANAVQVRASHCVEYVEAFKIGEWTGGFSSDTRPALRLDQNWHTIGGIQPGGNEQNELLITRTSTASPSYWSIYLWHPTPTKVAISVRRRQPLGLVGGAPSNALTLTNDAILSNVGSDGGSTTYDTLALSSLGIATELHRVTGNDAPSISVFNTITYPVANWIPEILSMSATAGTSLYTGAGARFFANPAGNWELAADLVGVTLETWKFDVSFQWAHPSLRTNYGVFS